MMDFKKRTERLRPEASAPETPYMRAKREWDNRIGSARVQAASWRLATFLLCGICMILSFGLIYQSSKSTVVPYVVRVDKIGRVESISQANHDYTPTKIEVRHFLAEFVDKIRSLPADPIVVKKHWSDAYAFLTTKGQNQLKSYAAEDKIFERISLEMVSVEVQNIVSINDDSYEIHWVEKTFNNQGVLIKTERYAGIFNVRFVKPKTTKRLLKNPLGIMVDSFNLSKQF